jgi:hypothetical protein
MAEWFVVFVEKIRNYYQGHNNFQHFLSYAINNNNNRSHFQLELYHPSKIHRVQTES